MSDKFDRESMLMAGAGRWRRLAPAPAPRVPFFSPDEDRFILLNSERAFAEVRFERPVVPVVVRPSHGDFLRFRDFFDAKTASGGI